jgi:hypothetical protein
MSNENDSPYSNSPYFPYDPQKGFEGTEVPHGVSGLSGPPSYTESGFQGYEVQVCPIPPKPVLSALIAEDRSIYAHLPEVIAHLQARDREIYDLCTGYPESFQLVFHHDVAYVAGHASTTNCIANNIEGCKPIEKLMQIIRNSEWPHSREVPLLQDFVKFTWHLYEQPKKLQEHTLPDGKVISWHYNPWGNEIVACLAVLAHHPEVKEARECLNMIASINPYEGDRRSGVIDSIQICGQYYLIDATCRKLNRTMRAMMQTTKWLDDDLRNRYIRDYAYRLWERDGRLPGKDKEHWLEAESRINDLVRLCDSLDEFCNMLVPNAETRQLWNMFG